MTKKEFITMFILMNQASSARAGIGKIFEYAEEAWEELQSRGYEDE